MFLMYLILGFFITDYEARFHYNLHYNYSVFSFSQTKVKFIDSFREECKKSHYLRPIDSLVYIYTIMNLADKDCVVWERASVDYKRQNFFSFFIKPILACSLAIDRDGKQLYRDPVGEI